MSGELNSKIRRARVVQAAMIMAALLLVVVGYQNCGPAFAPGKIDALQALSSASTSGDLQKGRTLYANNCAACHGPLDTSAKLNKSAAQISAAIGVITEMAVFKKFSQADINAIARALYRPVLGNPFVCDAGSDPAPAQLRRLTRREYLNSIQDLFAGQFAMGEIQAQLDYLPSEALDARPAIKLFDSMNPTPTNLKLITAYSEIAAKIADLVTASAAKMNALGGNTCISQASVTDSCLDGFLNGFGLKAYRRPLTSVEKASYLTLYRTGTSSADGLARVIEAMLQSPQFLYLIEDGGSSVNGRGDLLQLSGYEIASRLSYMITGSMPDAQLFAAAASGSLNTPAGIQQQVDRLFAAPKAKENIRYFYSQWLRLERIPKMVVSNEFANGIDPAQFQSEAKQEIVDFMDHVIWNQKGGFDALMTSDLAFVKGPSLSKIYGVPVSSLPQPLSDPNRKGLLTRAGMLTMSEIGTQDPIKRGVRVRLHLLCDELGAPPNNADDEAAPVDPLSSTRSQFAAKTSPNQCMQCHSSINPLGFAFGHFDGFGRYISEETIVSGGQSRTHVVDSRVEPAISMTSEPMIDGAVELQQAMMTANNNKGAACAAKQWMQYNVGRTIDDADSCSLSAMYDSLTRPGGSLLDMFKSLATTNTFRNKKVVP